MLQLHNTEGNAIDINNQVGSPSTISFDHCLFSNGKMIGTKICPVNKLSSFKRLDDISVVQFVPVFLNIRNQGY